MRIAVISPQRHDGGTTVALLLAQAMARTQGMKVMLTYTGQVRDVCKFMGVSDLGDNTRSISQIVKLLESQTLNPRDLTDYSMHVEENLYVMDTADPSVSNKEGAKLSSYVYKEIETDVSICDVATDFHEEVTQDIIAASDIMCVVMQPTRHAYNVFKRWKESEYWPKDKLIMIVINRYDPAVEALRNISKKIGVKHLSVCKLHNNPYIMRCANQHTSLSVLNYILNRDPRVIELNNDLREMCQFVTTAMKAKFKWEVVN